MRNLLLVTLLSVALTACGSDSRDVDSSPSTADTAAATTGEVGAAASSSGDATASSQATAGQRRFSVESGMIEASSNIMQSASFTTWFDHYGQRQATYVSVDVLGHHVGNVQIYDKGMLTSYSLADSTGTRTPSAAAPTMWGPSSDAGVPDLENIPADMRAKYDVKDLGTKEIAGQTATGYSLNFSGQPMEVWQWQGVPVRISMSMSNSSGTPPMVWEAKKIETGIDVPEEKFQIPDWVKFGK